MYIYNTTFDKNKSHLAILNTGEYECCTFINYDFSNINISHTKFITTKFIDCNLSNCSLINTSFNDVLFKNCKMLGLKFYECNKFCFSVNFENCQVDFSSFFRIKLNRSNFTDCQLIGVDFCNANLNNSKIIYCNLLDAIFENTNLIKCDFRQSINYSIDPENNKVHGAKFSFPEVIKLLDKYNLIIE